MNLLDPYHLLGVSPNSTMAELKQSYYQLSLLCHPDRGGNKDDMIIVVKAYRYIKQQFKNCSHLRTYEELEEDFETFCKEQEEIVPAFREIWENTEECQQLQEFNREFVRQREKELHKPIPSTYDMNPFNKGYGSFMDHSEYNSQQSNKQDCKELSTPLTYEQDESKKPSHTFGTKLIVYQDPVANPYDYGNNFRFDVQSINDFSIQQSNMSGKDYQQSHQEETFPESLYQTIDKRAQTIDELVERRTQFIDRYYHQSHSQHNYNHDEDSTVSKSHTLQSS